MNSLIAFAMGESNRGKELMVFDWDKAAQIIKDSVATYASAGLRGDWEWTGGDWEWTGGTIFKDGEIVTDDYTYLSSTWAVPELFIDGDFIPCYKMERETPGWGCTTKWPHSAIKILGR